MTTQKHNTLNPLHANGAAKAAAVAGRPVDAKANKLAAKADLDKLAKADIEQDIILAEAQTEAPVEVAMADGMDASAGSSIGAMEGGASAASSVSPLAIGAGVLGVAAVAAIAGSGGSSGGASNDNLQQKPPVDNGKKPDAVDPGKDTQSPNTQPPAAGGNDNTQPPAAGGNNTQQPSGPAVAGGEPAKPKVAVSGETKLQAETFFAGAANAESAPEFIRITNIIANETDTTERVRLVRFGEDDGAPKADASGFAAPGVTVKDPAAAAEAPKAPAQPEKMTAYEVIHVEGGITRAEAAQRAAALGGRLLTVDDAKEAAWLNASFKNLLENGSAWIAENKLEAGEQNSAIRNAAADGIDYDSVATDKLSSFVVEFGNYQHPLMLNGKPVIEGQIISRGDFGKLTWNGDNNTKGLFNYIAVESDQPTAKPLEGAKEQTVTLTEDASVKPSMPDAGQGGNGQQPGDQGSHTGNDADNGQTQPEDPFQAIALETQRLEHNKVNPISADVLKQGVVEGAKSIEILQIHSHDYNRGQRVINWHEGQEGKKPTAYELVEFKGDTEGLTLADAQALFESRGQSLLNIDDKAESDWLKGSLDGTLGVARNSYHFVSSYQPADPKLAEPVAGAEETRNKFVLEYPDYESPLMLVGDDGQITRLQPGAKVAIEDLDKIKWDTTQNVAGTFKFISVDDQGNAIEGAKSYVLPVNEMAPSNPKPLPPESFPIYPDSNTVEVALGHDVQAGKIDAAVFNGAPGGIAPAFIKIVTVSDLGALKVSTGDEATDRVLIVGSIVKASDFDKIVWDASLTEGQQTQFVFQALDANKHPVIDPLKTGDNPVALPDQTVTIAEHPKVPTYTEANQSFKIAHDGKLVIPAAAIKGTENPATFVKIVSVTGDGLKMGASASEGAGKAVKDGQIIKTADLDKLEWDAAGKAAGGSFTLQPVLENGTAIIGAKPVTITIAEDAALTQEVKHEAMTAIDVAHFGGATSGDQPKKFFKITSFEGKAEADEHINGERVLDSTSGHAYQVVKVGAEGITLEAARAAAKAAGGKLLKLDSNAELDWVKTQLADDLHQYFEPQGRTITDPKGQQTQVASALGEGVIKGAWMEAADSSVDAQDSGSKSATDMEGITGGSDERPDDKVNFVDLGSNTKMTAYVIEFDNYKAQKAGLFTVEPAEQDNQPAKVTPVTENQVIDSHKLNTLQWDSLFNNGGTIKFVEVSNQGGDAKAGALEKTLVITEADAPAESQSETPTVTEKATAISIEPKAVSMLIDDQGLLY